MSIAHERTGASPTTAQAVTTAPAAQEVVAPTAAATACTNTAAQHLSPMTDKPKLPKRTTLFVSEVPSEPLRYYVRSESSILETHMVDLLEHGGNGSCSCTDFTTRRYPRLREIGRIEEYLRGYPSTRCKHIDAAKNHFANTTLLAISQDNPLDRD